MLLFFCFFFFSFCANIISLFFFLSVDVLSRFSFSSLLVGFVRSFIGRNRKGGGGTTGKIFKHKKKKNTSIKPGT